MKSQPQQKQKQTKFTEDKVLSFLKRKEDVQVKGKSILCLNGEGDRTANDMGLSSWARVDYLTNKMGFRKVFVSSFDPKKNK